MNIYVASSWRNALQPEIVKTLRADGHEVVYDFKADGASFSWKDVVPDHVPGHDWPPSMLYRALDHPLAERGFETDMRALDACSACLLVLPCGKSAHLELGYAVGHGKLTIVLMAQPSEPELMYRMCDYFCSSLDQVREALSRERPRPRWQRDLADFDARGIHGGQQYGGPLPCALMKTDYRDLSCRFSVQLLGLMNEEP